MTRYLTPKEKSESSHRARKEHLCRWCGLDVHRLDKRRRTFCSPECVHEFMIRSSSGYIRQYIGKRDNYICQICGLNCKGFVRQLERYVQKRLAEENLNWVVTKRDVWEVARRKFEEEFFQQRGLEWVNTRNRSTFFDVDHIEAVAKGFGKCDETNLQTLCLSCHRKKTAQLRKELAATRKAAREAQAPEPLCEASEPSSAFSEAPERP